MDRQTDGPTNQWTDTASYIDERMYQKIDFNGVVISLCITSIAANRKENERIANIRSDA